MVFSSLLFLYLFLPILLIFYYIRSSIRYRNWVLILFSFLFYAWGEPLWVILLLGASFIGYLFALLIERYRDSWKGKTLFIIAIAINLSLLGFFKYIGFFIDNLNSALSLDLPRPDIGLPIGISFFTFEIICYLTDVYKAKIRAPRSPEQLLLYVSFFPHLVAGPIIRFSDIQHQMENRKFQLSTFSEGVSRFMIGLGKKVIIANQIGESVPLLLGTSHSSFFGDWLGIILFALQIYFDFSGYSDMAIGLGKMFGITLRENFNYPYIAKSAGDFWRRWNISLGGFFRDYVYIPLGGNRRFYVRNLFIVWFLTGFWHGASWNFIIWGLYFGLLIYMERMFLDKLLSKLPAFLSHCYLIVAMLIGWVFFYFIEIRQAAVTLFTMSGLSNRPLITLEHTIYFKENFMLILIAALASTPLFTWLLSRLMNRFPVLQGDTASVALSLFNLAILLTATIMLVGNSYNPFLYYRF
ncbi:MAG: MBOAT family protein [Candidatus Cohnella colombiensis]|uniref:MBOAT family protein n=1 Tax=Candidatus Cohnella colombiensis TaxID=3121368 RepID=A0AA95EYJ9_9BACL|nr:MAG: MBOAT family protein [Cohnella sp.]